VRNYKKTCDWTKKGGESMKFRKIVCIFGILALVASLAVGCGGGDSGGGNDEGGDEGEAVNGGRAEPIVIGIN
jgi:hypothetical protein